MSGKILPKSQKPRKTHFRTHYILAFPSPSHGKDEKAKRRLEKKVGIRVHALTHMKHIMHMNHMKHIKHMKHMKHMIHTHDTHETHGIHGTQIAENLAQYMHPPTHREHTKHTVGLKKLAQYKLRCKLQHKWNT